MTLTDPYATHAKPKSESAHGRSPGTSGISRIAEVQEVES